MTVEEKAIQMVNSYELPLRPLFGINDYDTEKHYHKECALVAVNELIRVTPWGDNPAVNEDDGSKYFYLNVKQWIINKL